MAGREPRLDLDLGRHRGDSRATATWAGCKGAGRPAPVLAARFESSWTSRASVVDATITTPQGIRFQVQGEVKLDETTSPRSLDWVKFTGADQQEFPPIPAIYKLDGDTFTVCNGGLNGTRPKEFKPGDGVLAEVVVFKREPERRRQEPKSPDKATQTTGTTEPANRRSKPRQLRARFATTLPADPIILINSVEIVRYNLDNFGRIEEHRCRPTI